LLLGILLIAVAIAIRQRSRYFFKLGLLLIFVYSSARCLRYYRMQHTYTILLYSQRANQVIDVYGAGQLLRVCNGDTSMKPAFEGVLRANQLKNSYVQRPEQLLAKRHRSVVIEIDTHKIQIVNQPSAPLCTNATIIYLTCVPKKNSAFTQALWVVPDRKLACTLRTRGYTKIHCLEDGAIIL
ncbi:MAG TPA: hypothetical protein VL947_07225, partial [Cytophagales bacterium]|nr:hypothetical protein [Cytophagales bacterium]